MKDDECNRAKNLKVIVFQLADKEYAIPVSHVKGIEKLMHITRVPKTERYVKVSLIFEVL